MGGPLTDYVITSSAPESTHTHRGQFFTLSSPTWRIINNFVNPGLFGRGKNYVRPVLAGDCVVGLDNLPFLWLLPVELYRLKGNSYL
jgi:hypothetical protein